MDSIKSMADECVTFSYDDETPMFINSEVKCHDLMHTGVLDNRT